MSTLHYENEEDMKYFRLCLIVVIFDLYEVDSLAWLRYKLLDLYWKYI